jgi:hypothetical protein
MSTRHHALTELAGCGCFPADLLGPGFERHLAVSIPLLAEAFEVEFSSPFEQFGVLSLLPCCHTFTEKTFNFRC